MSSELPGESRAHTASVVVLGADAVLAALPATPVQLAHACLRAGYQTVVPASWGDELLATETLRQVRERGRDPAVFCACPRVAARLLGVGSDLAPFLVSLVSPPVATARYLRALSGEAPIRITYVGRCPSASDPSIDAQFAPAEFLATLADRGIVLPDQPEVFDALLSPDRRRCRSLPGGLPTPELLWTEGGSRTLVELDGDDPGMPTQLAQHLFARDCVLVDLATTLGCVCSGAISSVPPRGARAAVAAQEPPRAPTPTVDGDVRVALVVPVAAPTRQPAELPLGSESVDAQSRPVRERTTPAAGEAPPSPPPGTLPRRRSPATGVVRHPESIPRARSGGRSLPRAYVARRRTSVREAGSAPPPGVPSPLPADGSAESAPPPIAPGPVRADGSAENGPAPPAGSAAPGYRLSEHPRHVLLLVLGVAIVSIALGLAAGASLRLITLTADRPADTSNSSRAEFGELPRADTQTLGSADGVAAVGDVSGPDTARGAPEALGARPTGVPNPVVEAPRQPARMPAPRRATGPGTPAAARPAENPRPGPGELATRRAVAALADTAPPILEPIAGTPRADSLRTAGPTPPSTEGDATAADGDAIRRELARRRARLDSLARVVESLDAVRRRVRPQ